jgi:type IV secretory pathway TraG/TraD family ATPase VirD4
MMTSFSHTTQPTIAQAPSSNSNVFGDIFQSLAANPTNASILGIAAVGIILMAVFNGGRKGKLATGRFAGKAEKTAATRRAKKLLKEGKHNAVALYVGSNMSLILPDAERGIEIVGGPGSGKSFSAVDPLIRSGVELGHPIVLFDYKYPKQSQRVAAYAKQLGYEVRVFAPGFEESEVCNLLEFLRSEDDALTARSIATIINKNFKLIAQASEDAFFTPAGEQLAEATLMLAKTTDYPDIAMVQAILSLGDDLPQRVRHAYEEGRLSQWIFSSFNQLISVAKSDRTVASIIGTANILFSRFMKPEILSVFCGESTIPLYLEGKKLLIFGMDREREQAVAPLLAAVLHMVVSHNVSRPTPRRDPLLLFLDECPSLYLPELGNWLNRNREDGLVTILGYQNISQLEKAYGREGSQLIRAGCATKIILNPQHYPSAREFSDFLGEEDIEIRQKSRNTGKNSSTTISHQLQRRALFAPNDFLRLGTGECIYVNPGYASKGQSYVPFRQKIKIPKTDLDRVEASKDEWNVLVKRLKLNASQVVPTRKDLENRYTAADSLLPPPPAPNNSPATLNREKYTSLL